MKKQTIIIISGIIVLIVVAIVIFGTTLINNKTVSNGNDVTNIEDALKDINNSDTAYVDESFSDLGSGLNSAEVSTTTTPAPISTLDKSKSINLIDDALTNTNGSGIDETGGYNVDFSNL